MNELPIDDVLATIVDELRASRRVVIEAPPGAGKSTRVPPALLDANLTDKQVVLLEPRRVAARAIATRIAEERGSKVGNEVGWQIRWDRRGGKQTKLWVLTEGILTRRVLSDPFLDDIGVLILDEFHERSVHTDLALGFARELLEVRDDLHVVVMSATLDVASVAEFLDCNSVRSDGRMFPVTSTWIDQPADDLPRTVARTVRSIISADDDDGGDILVFLPGLREIDDCRAACRQIDGLELHRLHGRLPDIEQDAALRPSNRRKVIFSTNIAETSLTIPSVTAVIDSGLVRLSRAEPGTGFDRLDTAETSLASARQRAGRAGRTAPGRAFHLWTRASEFRRREFDEPEIERIDLAGPVLDVMRWSGAPADDFAWYQTPGLSRLQGAVGTLEALGALDGGSVTAVGEQISDMPLHPRIARFLIAARSEGLGPVAARVAASLSEQDWVTAVSRDAPRATSDSLTRAQMLDDVAAGGTQRATRAGLRVNVAAARRTSRVARDLERWTGDLATSDVEQALARALAAAFPDRIGVQASGRRYALSRGGSVVIGYESLVDEPEFLIATSVFGTTRVDGVECAIVRHATATRREWLPKERFTTAVEVRFDGDLDRLVARRVSRFDDLVLLESTASVADADASDEALARALASEVAVDPQRAYALEREELQFFFRVEFLRKWMPELELPSPRDPEFLLQLVWGARSFAELRRKGFSSSYRRCLDGAQLAALDEHAPQRYPLRGRNFRIDYSDAEQPVLAARIQDFFGQLQTPRLAAGRVDMMLHLLAPNQRPQQVTKDLESFWANTYADIRKELRARYPKHDWPEDPFA